jgi:hypothetical protein
MFTVSMFLLIMENIAQMKNTTGFKFGLSVFLCGYCCYEVKMSVS